VRSIVGRFLEHSRVYYFMNGGEEEVYCSSADWMERNFFRRIEVAFPIQRQKHRERILRDLELYLSDTAQAWELHADGTYSRVTAADGSAVSAQQRLIEAYAAPGQIGVSA
jgi:polyphosphate kinase